MEMKTKQIIDNEQNKWTINNEYEHKKIITNNDWLAQAFMQLNISRVPLFYWNKFICDRPSIAQG